MPDWSWARCLATNREPSPAHDAAYGRRIDELERPSRVREVGRVGGAVDIEYRLPVVVGPHDVVPRVIKGDARGLDMVRDR